MLELCLFCVVKWRCLWQACQIQIFWQLDSLYTLWFSICMYIWIDKWWRLETGSLLKLEGICITRNWQLCTIAWILAFIEEFMHKCGLSLYTNANKYVVKGWCYFRWKRKVLFWNICGYDVLDRKNVVGTLFELFTFQM